MSHTGTVRGFATHTGPALAVMTGYGQFAHGHTTFLSSFILDLVVVLSLFFILAKKPCHMLSFVWFSLCCWMKAVAFEYRSAFHEGVLDRTRS